MFGRSTYQGQGIYQQKAQPIAGQLWGSALKDAGKSIADMITANKERARKDKEANQVASAMEKVLDYTAGDSSWKPDNWEELGPQARVQLALGLQSQITAEQERKRAEEQQAAIEQRTADLLGSLDPDLAGLGRVDPSLVSALLSNERGKDELMARMAADQANAAYRNSMLDIERERLKASAAGKPLTFLEQLQEIRGVAEEKAKLGELGSVAEQTAFYGEMTPEQFASTKFRANPIIGVNQDLLSEWRGATSFKERGEIETRMQEDIARRAAAFGIPEEEVYVPDFEMIPEKGAIGQISSFLERLATPRGGLPSPIDYSTFE